MFIVHALTNFIKEKTGLVANKVHHKLAILSQCQQVLTTCTVLLRVTDHALCFVKQLNPLTEGFPGNSDP